MRRMILAVVLLAGGVLGAQADPDIWVSVQPRHDPNAAAQIDADSCTRTVGPDLNGQPTPAKFKRCMASRGWRFGHTTRERTTREDLQGYSRRIRLVLLEFLDAQPRCLGSRVAGR